MQSHKKRSLFAGALLASALLALSACSGGAASQPAEPGADDPIRIGLVTSHSGPYAAYGEEARTGFNYAFDELNANGGIDGHPIEVFEGDDLGTAEGAVAAAQRLVQQNEVDFLVGPIATPVVLALAQRAEDWGVLFIGHSAQGIDLTADSCTPNFFRANNNDTQIINTVTAWLEQNPDLTDWDAIGADYSLGHDTIAALKDTIGADGNSLGQELYAPFGTTDFGAYLSQLDGGDGLLIVNAGNDQVNLLSQSLEFGTLENYDAVVTTVADATLLDAIGDDRIQGLIGASPWASTIDNADSRAFTEAFLEATGKDFVAYNEGSAYIATQTLVAGIEAAQSIDPLEVRDALEGLTYTTLKGETTMRAEDHQALTPVYLGPVARVDGVLNIVPEFVGLPEAIDPEPSPGCQLPSR
ncbi:ABC transporter substrate-binding protein [Microbacterium sp. NPDC076895]|uniref:ABC transporter substrate-binding protein n=1 Tax=Microbacterium sp. NPDC076895 TaxID=3154957 RepID=UPI003414C753